MILAGDIGATKTNLALFSNTKDLQILKFKNFKSREYQNLQSIISEFMEGECVVSACFAVPGPIYNETCHATNLPWTIELSDLSVFLNNPSVFIINDLEAGGYSIDLLSAEDLVTIHLVESVVMANRGIISPGSGLGEAGLYWDGRTYHPFACEGGHCDFAPCDDEQIEFCSYLIKRFGHASYERILSGPGLINIFDFLVEVKKMENPAWLRKEFTEDDPSKAITYNALNKKSDVCVKTLDLFVSILGSECGNLALKFMSLSGIYLGGGIVPKILPKLLEKGFLDGFLNKGRFAEILKNVPIYAVMNERANLIGAARYSYLLNKNL